MKSPIRIMKRTKVGKRINSWLGINKKKRFCKHLARTANIDEKKIIFSAFNGRLYACSPKAIYEGMVTDPRFDEFTFVWAFKSPDKKWQFFDDERTILVKYNSQEFFRHLTSSKYWIFNFKTPSYFIKNSQQIFLQCWHGTPLKKIGLDIDVDNNAATKLQKIYRSYLEDVKKYDLFLSASRFATKRFLSGFGMKRQHKSDIVIEEGYPRNDALFYYSSEKITQIKTDLGIDHQKKVLLYCPTFRDNKYKSGVGHTYDFSLNLLRMKDALAEDCVILLRLHYLVSNTIDISQFMGFAIDVSEYDDVNDLYAASDLLITDYSSVFFDYANLNKPIVFYMYDLEDYRDDIRDFYLGLDDLPGPIVKSEIELINILKQGNSVFSDFEERYQEFKNKFTYLDDGSATGRVIERLISYENR